LYLGGLLIEASTFSTFLASRLIHKAGFIFAFNWKKLVGSYLRFNSLKQDWVDDEATSHRQLDE